MGKNVNQPEYKKDKKFITSCIFRLKSIPAALYKCLGRFCNQSGKFNKIREFSVKNTFDQTNFYLDIEGHIEDQAVQKALRRIRLSYRKLGYFRSLRSCSI